MPAACFNRSAAGGLLVTKSKVRSLYTLHHHRDRHAAGFLGAVVELRDELTEVDAEAAQGRAHRRGRRRLPAGNLKLHFAD